jgi:hypothetical protein
LRCPYPFLWRFGTSAWIYLWTILIGASPPQDSRVFPAENDGHCDLRLKRSVIEISKLREKWLCIAVGEDAEILLSVEEEM